MLNIGPSEKLIIEQAKKRKQPIPDTIKNAPELYNGLDFYYEAFNELTSTRSFGQVQGPIPWTAINEYSIRFNIFGTEAFSYFVTMIRVLDDVYLKFLSKKSKTSEGTEND